jgi:putative NADH-flavin reductase
VRITVFGATGGTGTHLVEQALAAGNQVTAVVRDPARLPAGSPELTMVRGDLTDPSSITGAVRDADAVISAIGTRDGRVPTTVCADSAASIITAMRSAGAHRLIVVSNSGMHVDEADGPFTRFVVKPILARVLRFSFADMARMEKLVRASGLDWTIVQPPMLTDGRRTGACRIAIDRNVRGGNRVSRADLADQILRCLTDDRTTRAAVAVAD